MKTTNKYQAGKERAREEAINWQLSFGEHTHTASDAACGYGVTNYLNRPAEIVYHYTRRGTLIIDFIKDIKK